MRITVPLLTGARMSSRRVVRAEFRCHWMVLSGGVHVRQAVNNGRLARACGKRKEVVREGIEW